MTTPYELRYLPVAEEDLLGILDYIARDDPEAARRFVDYIEHGIGALTRFPKAGRQPRDARLRRLGYRVLVLDDYLVFYVLIRRTVQVRRVIHGARRFTWEETYARCRRLASALAGRGIGTGDTVAVMLANTPEMVECHFGVPMTGGVLLSLNTRLDAEAIAFMLEHGEAKVLLTDREFSDTVAKALQLLPDRKILVIDVDDQEYRGEGDFLGETKYENFLLQGDPEFAWRIPDDEWDAISLNYTSGTTGNPKGVVYHHRGAYLNAISNILDGGMPPHAVYLWTLPMFHCNGWCFPWSISVVGGTHVTLRWVRSHLIWEALATHGVTSLCGAPIVMPVERGRRHRPHGYATPSCRSSAHRSP